MDTNNFKKLLEEGKEAEAQELLEQFLASSISPKEQGQAIIALVSAYMETQNVLNREYIRILKNAATEISELKKEETEITDTISLAKARMQIKNSSSQKPN